VKAYLPDIVMAGPVASEKSILQTTNFSVHLVICLYVPEHQKSVVLVLPLLRLATNLASPCLAGLRKSAGAEIPHHP
jgi:hypothetical protein